jgi:ABC-type bacteriocin/lantibiotic exporter with double-glycine peptidase domain
MLISPPVYPTIPNVPFHSQFTEIDSSTWQKVGCGITSLAMIIDYYQSDSISVNVLLGQGILAGAYNNNAGWIHQGLISLAKKYGLDGKSYDLSSLTKSKALTSLQVALQDGPVMASIHYKFNPKSTIPHLIVVDGIRDGVVYYNDPAAKTGQKQISTNDFLLGWKKRYIVIRPTQEFNEKKNLA